MASSPCHPLGIERARPAPPCSRHWPASAPASAFTPEAGRQSGFPPHRPAFGPPSGGLFLPRSDLQHHDDAAHRCAHFGILALFGVLPSPCPVKPPRPRIECPHVKTPCARGLRVGHQLRADTSPDRIDRDMDGMQILAIQVIHADHGAATLSDHKPGKARIDITRGRLFGVIARQRRGADMWPPMRPPGLIEQMLERQGVLRSGWTDQNV